MRPPLLQHFRRLKGFIPSFTGVSHPTSTPSAKSGAPIHGLGIRGLQTCRPVSQGRKRRLPNLSSVYFNSSRTWRSRAFQLLYYRRSSSPSMPPRSVELVHLLTSSPLRF